MPTVKALQWTLRSIARIEQPGGLRTPRLTEPGFEKWHRLRRTLGWRDFIALLHDDLAESFPVPFARANWSRDPIVSLTDEDAAALVQQAASSTAVDANAFLAAASRDLGQPEIANLASVPRPLPRERVLELPGTVGRIAAAQVVGQAGLSFHDQFAYVADSDEERLLIGLAAVEARANPPTILTTDEVRAQARKGHRYDRVVGVRGWAPAESLVAELGWEARWA